MALTISAPHVDQPESPIKALVADRRLYLAADERTLVESGDARARFLLAAKGMPIPGHDVQRLRLEVADARVVQRPSAPAANPKTTGERDGAKQGKLDGDKMLSPQDDKSAAGAAVKRERK